MGQASQLPYQSWGVHTVCTWVVAAMLGAALDLLKIFVAAKTGHDDFYLDQLVNGCVAVFLAGVAGEGVARLRSSGKDSPSDPPDKAP